VADEEWTLVSFEASCGTGHSPRVKLTLHRAGEEFSAEATEGDGPIDAAFFCTEKITGMKLVCKDFQVRSATIGHDAQGSSNVEVEYKGQSWRGRGVSTDTVEATVMAILDAVNRIALAEKAKTGALAGA
jgi:2-isopropylmalate synthase